MKVFWRPRALRQLREIYAYIARDNPRAAQAVVAAVEALAQTLGAYPGMGVETDEPGVMMFPLPRYRSYLLYYTVVRGEEVHILRVRHAKRRRP